MKVWINKRYGGYTGGMIIVAANSAEEAHETFHNDYRYGYMYTKLEDGSYLDHEYFPENWEEVPYLFYDEVTPYVIDEAGYSG